MEEKTINEVNNLISQFDNPENQEKVKEAKLENPIEELGKNIFDFMGKRLDYIDDLADFKAKVKNALIGKIDNDKDVTFTQLSILYTNLTEQESIASEQVVSLLRPSQGSTTNPLLATGNKDKEGKKFEETKYDVETQKKIDVIYRTILGKTREQE